MNRRDLDGFLARWRRTYVLIRSRQRQGAYKGDDGMCRGWKSLFGGVPYFTMELIEVRDLGDDLVLAVAQLRRGRRERRAI